MFRDSSELMTCASCQEAAILTVEDGLCPRCFYKQECEAICSAAEDEVDRVLTEGALAPETTPEPVEPPRIYVPEEQVWGW
jgi:hypothetical protein